MYSMPADETLALRRLQVAIRRHDHQRLATAIERLAEDLDRGAVYSRISEWQACHDAARADLAMPPLLTTRLTEVLSRVFHAKPPARAIHGRGRLRAVLGVVAAWDGVLTSDHARATCLRVLDRSTSTPVSQLKGWFGSGASVESVASRANALLSAAHLGALDRPPPWMDALVAGLQAAASDPDEKLYGYRGLSPSLSAGSLPSLLQALEAAPGGGIVTSKVGMAWEDALDLPLRRLSYDPEDAHLVKLGGSLDWFYCFRCVELAEANARPLAIACPRCGGPCWPLVAPPSNPYFSPSPLREVWAAGERVLAKADHWVIVDPPSPRAADPVARWIMRGWMPEKRIAVVSAQRPVLEAWRVALERQGSRRVLTASAVEGVIDDLLTVAPA